MQWRKNPRTSAGSGALDVHDEAIAELHDEPAVELGSGEAPVPPLDERAVLHLVGAAKSVEDLLVGPEQVAVLQSLLLRGALGLGRQLLRASLGNLQTLGARDASLRRSLEASHEFAEDASARPVHWKRMDAHEHPLRRRYALELALGIAVLLLAAWLLLRDEPRGSRPGRTLGEVERSSDAEVAQLTAPEPIAEPAGEALPAREAVGATRNDEPLAEVLDVLVVDSIGAPAPGVPLTAQVETDGGRIGLNGRRPELLTDAAGRVRVPVDSFGAAERLAVMEGNPRNVLRVCVPLRAAPVLDFGATVPAAGPVTLVLPPCGRVRLRVAEEDGQPVAGAASVWAQVRDALGNGTSAMAEVRDGVAEFSWIELGAELELKAFYDDQRTRPSERARLTLLGPLQDGQTVEGELFLGLEWPRITFRAVDERGAALAFASLQLRLSEGASSPQDARCICDRDGRGELRLMSAHRSAELRTLDVVLARPSERAALVVLPPELELGHATELGDLVLVRTR